MALPSLPSCWSHKHKHIEQQLSRMHQQRQRFHEQWNDASGYFQKHQVKNNARSSMFSESSYKKSMDAYATVEEKNRKAAVLHKRREKLKNLLSMENTAYEAELRNYSLDNYSRLKDMQNRSENLKSAREEKRKQIAEEKLYEHWKENNPDLRKLEKELHKDHIKRAWGEQTERRQRVLMEEKQQNTNFANEYEEARLKAMENIKRKEEQRVKEEKENARALQQQMKELKEREESAVALRKEEEKIVREQHEIEKLQEKRKAMEERRKQMKLQRFLHHQYRAQIRRRTQQIQEELEFDRKILDQLQEEERKETEIRSARQQKAKADVKWMKKVLEDQMKLEQEREAELDLVYREEARQMWEQREEEWKKEREAREKLMQEVIGERQQQIADRALTNRRQQEELLREREELLLNLEEVQKTARHERDEEEKKKLLRLEELEGQMTERHQQSERHRRQMQEELRREKEEEEDYDKLMQVEEARMRELGFQAKRRPRSSRHAWE